MKASDLLVRCLELEGVEYVFGIPGEENIDLIFSLQDSKIKFIVTRHEQAAAFMADAYGRMTGKPGVCLGTLGPGATNLLTGVASANIDHSPLIVITGQAHTDRLHKESHQVINLVELFEPCVKWGAIVEHPDTIPEVVRKAFRVATQPKQGSCHIDLPVDVAKLQTIVEPIEPVPAQAGPPPKETIQAAMHAIQMSTFPILLVGNGVIRSHAHQALTDFAQQCGIPVVSTFMGKGCFPTTDPLYLFTVGLGSRDYPDVAIEEADCVIAVGFDMVEYHPRLWNRGHSKKIIHIDQVPAEIDDHYRTTFELIGDIQSALRELTKIAQPHSLSPDRYAPFRDAMLQVLHDYEKNKSVPLKPERILSDVQKFLSDDDLVFIDVGAHKLWSARYLHCNQPNHIVMSNGFCAMGFALPAAIGAKIACPKKRVLALCGDGGFLMNIQELETAVREKLPIVFMVWCDEDYGLISWKQHITFQKEASTRFTNPDWKALAKSFGMKGFEIHAPSDILPTLKKAFAANQPSIIAVPIDHAENLRLTEMLQAISYEEIYACLRKIDLFENIPERYYPIIAERMEEHFFEKNTVIFSQGADSDALYLIHSGTVLIQKDGQEIATMHAGESFGEMAAILDHPRSATVVALEDVMTSRLNGEAFKDLIRSQPELGLFLTRLFAERLLKGKK